MFFVQDAIHPLELSMEKYRLLTVQSSQISLIGESSAICLVPEQNKKRAVQRFGIALS